MLSIGSLSINLWLGTTVRRFFQQEEDSHFLIGFSHPCLMLAVALVLHCRSQPSDALFTTLLPEQRVPAVIFKVKSQLPSARAIHVIVKLKTLRPPGAPQWARKQPNTVTRQHGRSLHVQIVSCQQTMLWWVVIRVFGVYFILCCI